MQYPPRLTIGVEINKNVVAVKRFGTELPVAGLSEVAVTVAGQRRYGLILV